ncbi:MAG: Rieske 2Fe-2S domain-containing protein [Candidatus Sericytochromatia bacterium]|nr:Rieske 2Fe-2S domain-containing protein [Candidatus Sericytochromatia bacterium]
MALPIESESSEKLSRRDFLWYTLIWSGLGASLLSTLAYLRLPAWSPGLEPVVLGVPQDLSLGEVKAFPAYQTWLIRNESGFYALRSVCTHLGCTPVWKSDLTQFHCPCHHSYFDLAGLREKGPALRALERYRLFWGQQGEIMLDRSQTFRRELGEWEDAGAWLPFPRA